MSSYIIKPSPPLCGTVKTGGSKNAALPILAATLLSGEPCTLKSVPLLSDVSNMLKLLKSVGAEIASEKPGVYGIFAKNPSPLKANAELMMLFRASVLVAGPLLARCGCAKISMPGGCAIGTRPVDLHLKGLAALGAKITKANGYIDLKCKKLKGASVYLDFPSVGATENILMAATLAEGETIIENAATEPEIEDLAAFLCSMGAKIKGAGTDRIKITGVPCLSGCSHKIIPDRIEAGTFLVAAAMLRGNVTVENVNPNHLKPVSAKLREVGATVLEGRQSITVSMEGKIRATDIKTLPYPGFPTDMQSQFSALLAISDGSSMVTETIFENRFMHLAEIKKMGASVKVESRTAVISGVKRLSGANLRATDLRAGAALTIAALSASSDCVIEDISHIERGYENFPEKLKSLGANITRWE